MRGDQPVRSAASPTVSPSTRRTLSEVCQRSPPPTADQAARRRDRDAPVARERVLDDLPKATRPFLVERGGLPHREAVRDERLGFRDHELARVPVHPDVLEEFLELRRARLETEA